MRQIIVLPMARKRKGEKAQQIVVEVQLACESQTMDFQEQQQYMGRLAERVASLVVEEFGGEVIQLPPQQQRG